MKSKKMNNCTDCNKDEAVIKSQIKSNKELLTAEQLLFINSLRRGITIQSHEVNEIFKIYNKLFNTASQRCNCPLQILNMIDAIKKFIK